MVNDLKEIDSAKETAEKLLDIVRQLSMELSPHQGQSVAVGLDSVLDRDLGIDSLGRVELLSRLEQAFDLTIPEQSLMMAETSRDLLWAVMNADGRVNPGGSSASVKLDLAATEPAPHSAATLTDILQWHANAHPERGHITLYSDHDEGEVISYGELLKEADRIASSLQDLGVLPKEAVVIMLPTGKDYFCSFFGVLRAGCIPVPVYPPGRISQLEEHLLRHVAIVENCRAAAMITMPEAMAFSKLLRSRVENLRHVVVPDELRTMEGGLFQPPVLREGDVALLQYTSGSTGAPKGVMLTHANLLANIRSMGQALEVTSEDVFVSWLPLYHDMGLIGGWLGSLYYAMPLVVMSPLSFIARPWRWLRAIDRYGGTLSAAPNFAYELCIRRLSDEDIADLDLSSLRQVLNGAEAVSPETIHQFIKRFEPYGFKAEAMMPVFGLAECSVGLAFPPLNRPPIIDHISRKALMQERRAEPANEGDTGALSFVACGRPILGHEIRIVDETDRELPERREGLIQFRGPSTTMGYLRAPDQTASLFHGKWLESGDRGYIAEGDIYITGRRKDIIIRAGRNIYPEEMEQEVGKIDGIRAGNVAVFGSKDAQLGTERLVVLAETRKRKPELLAEQRNKISAIVTQLTDTPPEDIVLAPPNTVLKTSSGKIRRAACRDLYENGDIGGKKPAIWIQIGRLITGSFVPQSRRLWTSLKATLYAAWFWKAGILMALVIWPGVMLLPKTKWRWGFVRHSLRVLLRICGIRLILRGQEQGADPTQPTIFVANHQSYLDSLVMIAALPHPVSFIAKAELTNNFFARAFLTRLETRFAEREDAQKSLESASEMAELGRSGRSLMFFAEGTFTRSPGVRPFHLGAFETAAETGCSVTPVAIRGTRSILRDGQWYPHRGAVTISFGPPMGIEGTGFSAVVSLRDQVRSWILQHCGEPDLVHETTALPQTD